MKTYSHWINGGKVPPSNNIHLERHSPADGTLLASYPEGTAEDAAAAVASARHAFDGGAWRDMAGDARGAILMRLADLMEQNAETLARLDAEEAGKPIQAARKEVGISVGLTRYAASQAWGVTGRLMTDSGPEKLGFVMHQPRGVALLIVAWNYPLLCLMQKLPYALAAGCSVVVKPSELTPGSTLEIARLAEEAGVPAGQINVAVGTGPAVGDALTTAPGIDMVSFTGSTAVGRRVAKICADNFKHCALELGGKGANIIFADADIDAAVEATFFGYVFNKGEECCSSARILVEASIAEEFSAKLAKRSERVTMGHPLDEETDMGPLVSEAQLERVLGYIGKGKKEGARLILGGARRVGGAYDAGYFVPPTIFADVTREMTVFQEEIFGPVATISTFETLDEALALANDTDYGLANGVWTKDFDKAMVLVRQLKGGMTYVNTYLESIVQLPLGGMKQSGMGHENGIEGLKEFLETRSAFFRLNAKP